MLADGVPENNFLVAGYGIAGKTEEAGTNYMPFYQVDGVVHYGILEEGFKEYVEMLNRWYSEGLFATDFATMDNSGRDSIQASEMCAIWYTGSSACGLGDEAGGMFTSDDPNYHVVAIADAVKEEGDMNHLSTIAKYKTNHSMSISTSAENPELVAQWLNFWYTDMGSQLANYGVEGEGCTIDENGVPGFSELITNNPDGTNYRDCLSLYTVTCVAYYSHVNRDMVTYNSDVIEAGSIWTSNRDDAYNYPDMALLNVEESEEFSRLYADLRTLISERLPEFIMGVRSMDEWDSFVATLEDMGIEDCIALKQAAYDRYIAR
jgi:putative aldouronate transport system substrate-binding protein